MQCKNLLRVEQYEVSNPNFCHREPDVCSCFTDIASVNSIRNTLCQDRQHGVTVKTDFDLVKQEFGAMNLIRLCPGSFFFGRNTTSTVCLKMRTCHDKNLTVHGPYPFITYEDLEMIHGIVNISRCIGAKMVLRIILSSFSFLTQSSFVICRA
jgi:hypothetical protein